MNAHLHVIHMALVTVFIYFAPFLRDSQEEDEIVRLGFFCPTGGFFSIQIVEDFFAFVGEK